MFVYMCFAPTSDYLSCPRFSPLITSGNVLARSCEYVRRHRVTLYRATYFYRYGYSVFLISVLRVLTIANKFTVSRIAEKSFFFEKNVFSRHFG